MYRDYPISQTRFHWESQSGTHEGTKIGQRYVRHQERGTSVLLFLRHKRKDERGVTSPYLCLGEAKYVRHEGGRPMQVEWELERAMPVGEWLEVKVAGG